MSKVLGVVLFLIASPVFAFHVATQVAPGKGNTTQVTMNVDIGGKAFADIIFVIDDSGSMSAHQQNLIKNINALSSSLSAYNNINTAVITTSAALPNVPFPNPPKPSGGQFVGPVLNSSEKEFLGFLTAQLDVGTNGDATEKPLEMLSKALSEPLISTTNKNFLRPEADLFVMFLTDTEDQGAVTPQNLWQQLQSLKPNNTIKTFAGMITDPNKCPGEALTNLTGLQQFLSLSGGVAFDLCSDFAQTIPDALGQLEEISNVFELQVFPNTKVLTKSIVVSIGSKVLTAGDAQEGWIFDPLTNKLTVGSDVLIKPGSNTMTISYSLVAK